jgi:branched-chain amino acid transport system substrate-binding protein
LRQRFVRAIGGVAMAALIAGGAAACKQDEGGTTGGGGAASCDLKIGFFGGLTGDNAGLVVPMKNGAALALEEFTEANPDCKVEIADFDSQGTPDKAPALATTAAADTKIVGMIGPAFSGESEVAVPIFEQANLPLISPSATRPSLSQQGWKVFHRGVGNDLSQGPAAANYIKNVMKADKVFVVDDQSAYGAGLAEEATKTLGPIVVGNDKVTEKQTDFAGVISKIKSSGVNVVFYGGYTAEASPFLKQLRRASWTGTMVGGDGINDNNMISTTGNADVEGTLATCPCAPATEAEGTFAQDYQAKFNIAPAVYADVSYDLMNVFLDGIKDGKKDRAALLEHVKGYNKQGKATGVTYKWEASGELDPAEVKVWMYKAVNGAWAPDQEIPKA